MAISLRYNQLGLKLAFVTIWRESDALLSCDASAAPIERLCNHIAFAVTRRVSGTIPRPFLFEVGRMPEAEKMGPGRRYGQGT